MNQYATKLRTTKPPPNESIANKPASFNTTLRECSKPARFVAETRSPRSLAISAAGERRLKRKISRNPTTAYKNTMARSARSGAPVRLPKACEMIPAHKEPVAVATAPIKVYRANISVRFRSGTTCDRAACSMDRNGPTSLPLGLVTPIVPATNSRSRLLVTANVTPAAAISTAPGMRVRRRPNRSARVVSHSETSVSPINVSVRSIPGSESLSPSAVR